MFSPVLLTISAHHCHFSPKEGEREGDQDPAVHVPCHSALLHPSPSPSAQAASRHTPGEVFAQGKSDLEIRTFSMPC